MNSNNKVRGFLLGCFWLIVCYSYSQNTPILHLDIIKDYRIKLDGGCGFFASDSIPIESGNFIFIVNSKNTCFFNTNNKYVYLKKTKRINENEDYYHDVFSTKNGEVILKVKRSGKFDDYYSLYEGTLQIKQDGQECLVKVHGKVGAL